MTTLLVVLFGLALGAQAATCNTYYCGALESGMCARVLDGVVTINNSTCPDGTYCSLVDTTSWVTQTLVGYTISSMSYNYVYKCQTGAYDLKPTNPDYLSCPARPLRKDLSNGSFPQQCTTLGWNSPECQLLDLTFSECACGLDGKSYCVPSIGASIYDNYWEECTTTAFRGSIASLSHWVFWTLKMQYYLQYMTGYSCAHKVFAEFQKIDDLQYTSSGLKLALSGLALVALISG